MARWGVAAAYVLLTCLALGVAVVWQWRSPMIHPAPWLVLEPLASHLYSGGVGLAFGGLVVMLTPPMVDRWQWVRNLHQELRPIARAMSPTAILVVAPTSGFVEEILFRGLLGPAVGLLPQALLFGLVHYLPGRSRWVWAVWAMAIGLALGVIFQLTGSLVGPIIAHTLINGLNLRYLRRHDPTPPPPRLGGLLGLRGGNPTGAARGCCGRAGES
ncbi:MAG: CPBP family intramembrane metalloprotease [Polyangiaceae bacterium]|nr:CPBP family intramembrane metalloprotease [Polyangiaceae bacterium]